MNIAKDQLSLQCLSQLNKKLRTWQILTMFSFLCTATVLFCGSSQNITKVKQLDVEHINIVNKDGKTRISLYTDSNNNPVIGLMDGEQNPRLRLSIGANGQPSVSLLEKDGATRLAIQVTNDSAAQVTLMNQSNNPCIMMSVMSNSKSSMSFSDKTGIIRSHIGIDETGAAQFAMRQKSGNPAITIGLLGGAVPVIDLNSDGKRSELILNASNGKPSIMLNTSNSRSSIGISILDNHAPFIGIHDRTGVLRASLGTDGSNSPSLGLFDGKGRPQAMVGVSADGVPVSKGIHGEP